MHNGNGGHELDWDTPLKGWNFDEFGMLVVFKLSSLIVFVVFISKSKHSFTMFHLHSDVPNQPLQRTVTVVFFTDYRCGRKLQGGIVGIVE